MKQTVMSKKLTNRTSHLMDEAALSLTSLAKWVGINKTALSNYKQADRKMPVDVAAKINRVLCDTELSQEFAATFFNAFGLYSTRQWQSFLQDDPYAIKFQQKIEERERIDLDESAFEELLIKGDTEKIKQWSKELAQEIAIEMLWLIKTDQARGINPYELITQWNEEMR